MAFSFRMSNNQRAPCGDFQTPLVRVWLPERREQFLCDSSVYDGTHISKIKQPSSIQTDCVREIENTRKLSFRRLPDRLRPENAAASRTSLPSFLPSFREALCAFHALPCTLGAPTCLPLRVLTPAETGASSLVMNAFPFLTFLKLLSLPGKTRAFPGLAVGG